MTESLVERELKFDVGPEVVLPDTSALAPAGGHVETATEQLCSDYFDTSDHALLRAQITLRRRTGTTDTGWHLKIPHPPFPEEVRTELTPDDTVPDQLQRLLVGVLGGRSLIQVASVRTQRTATRVVDAAGRRLLEIADDLVHASAVGTVATASSWREVEVEVAEDALKLLDRLGRQLQQAGARPSSSTSKLARALSGDSHATARTTQSGKSNRKRKGKRGKVQNLPTLTAGEVVAGYLAQQQQALLVGDIALRRSDARVIHRTRVATRRLRSTLRVYGKLFDADRASSLDGELRWYAAVLGEVRDRQVQRKRLDGMLDNLAGTLQLGPVRARVHTELDREEREHWQNLQHELTGRRYLALLADVDAFVSRPPWTGAAGKPGRTMAPLLAQAEKRVSRRLDHANAADDIDLLHGARKAAKRARYAAEAAEPVIGPEAAAAHAERYQQLQDLLGEHQDSLVTADLLRRLGAEAGTTPGENGFAFGILYEREAQAAATARAEARRVARTYR